MQCIIYYVYILDLTACSTILLKNSSSAGQEIPRPLQFTKPEGSLPCSQQSTSCPYPDPDKTSPRPPRSVLILTSHLHLSHQSTSVIQVSPQTLHARL